MLAAITTTPALYISATIWYVPLCVLIIYHFVLIARANPPPKLLRYYYNTWYP
jgi:hypothetical protein